MEKLSLILLIIGAAVLVFTIWGSFILRNHIKQYNANGRVSASLNDQKYYELKARQDYIIASSTIIFAVLSFIGFSSVQEIKSDLKTQFATEKLKLDSLYSSEKLKMDSLKSYANETNSAYDGLKIEGNDLKDSMRSSLILINILRTKFLEIANKEIIRQNLFIVDNIRMNELPIAKRNGEDSRYVSFDKLRTISGKKLPEFTEIPSMIVFTKEGQVVVTDVTKEGFKITPFVSMALEVENDRAAIDYTHLQFSIWITQKEKIP